MLCVIATDDGVHLMGRHFGDAARYDLYVVSRQDIVFQETIVNPFRDDDDDDINSHESKVKAKNMKELFLERNVQALVSKRFGPNVRRMVKNFVPIVVRHENIEKARELLVKHAEEIEQMFQEGQERKPIILK